MQSFRMGRGAAARGCDRLSISYFLQWLRCVRLQVAAAASGDAGETTMAKQDPELTKFPTKKCYECFTHLPLNATVCNVCKKKVGKVNRFGLAEKPTDWKAYTIAGVAIFLLVAFFVKVFLK
jgi:hypothetical protein